MPNGADRESVRAMIDIEVPSSLEAAPPRPRLCACPECGAPLAHLSGCAVCLVCGHSTCG